LPTISERMRDVQVECSDWRVILERYHDRDRYLAYLDPPYVTSTRKAKRYKHEMTDEDHQELIDRLLEYPSMVMLSGYAHQIYQRLDAAGWHRTEYQVSCSAAGHTRATGIQGRGSSTKMQPRTEIVWRNPMCIEKMERERMPLFEEGAK